VEETDLKWRKASYSSNGGATCVEVAEHADRVLVRDTKDHGHGPVLRFSPDAWRRFTGRVKRSLADPVPILEGYPRVLRVAPSACLGSFPSRQARRAGHFPRSFVRPVPHCVCALPGHLCGEFGRVGEAGKGVWGKTWNRAVGGARGGPGFPPALYGSCKLAAWELCLARKTRIDLRGRRCKVVAARIYCLGVHLTATRMRVPRCNARIFRAETCPLPCIKSTLRVQFHPVHRLRTLYTIAIHCSQHRRALSHRR
jgi:hypothetical protein